MSQLRPGVSVALGGRALSAAEAGLGQLQVRLGRGTHDSATLRLWPRSKFATAAVGDTLAIQLGVRDDALADVWAGVVTTVSRTPDAVRLVGHSRTSDLSRAYKSQTYVGQTVADIVRDLVSDHAIDAVDGSAELAYYAVDARRSIWGHLLDLAALSGAEITSGPAGGLRFRPVSPLPSTTRFRFGADLLDWQLEARPASTATTYAASGAASEAGSDKWHWLSADPTSGAGGAQVIGAFATRALAEDLSSASAAAVERAAVGGHILLVGQAGLRPGDVFSLVDLADAPDPLRALAVEHHVDGRGGFRTYVQVEGA